MSPSAKSDAQTPRARLASVIKTSRDIMRKDAGLNGDLDRLPQLSWLLFLKAFDDLEQNRMIVDPDTASMYSTGPSAPVHSSS